MLLLVALQLVVFGYQTVLHGRQADLATMDRQDRTYLRLEATEKARRDAFDHLLYMGDEWRVGSTSTADPCDSDCRAVPVLAAAARQYEWRHGAQGEDAPFDDAVGRAAQVIGDLQLTLHSTAALLEQKGKRAALLEGMGAASGGFSVTRLARDSQSCGGEMPALLWHGTAQLQQGDALVQLLDAGPVADLDSPDPHKRRLAQLKVQQRWINATALPGRPPPDEERQAADSLARVDQAVRTLRQFAAEREPPAQALNIATTGDLIDAVRAAGQAHSDEIDRFVEGCDEQIRRYGGQLESLDRSRN
jgi:hypothetical protein